MVTSNNSMFTPLKKLVGHLDSLVQGRLWLKVVIGLFLGVLAGILLGPDLALFSAVTVKTISAWVALPGQVFLAIIQMIVVPLVLASVVLGLASNNNPDALRKNGGLAVLFIVISTAIAAAVGISLALHIKPGDYVGVIEQVEGVVSSAASPGFPAIADLPDKVSSLIPKNPLASMASGEMLQVILFAVVLGLALMSIPAKQAQPLFDLLVALQEVSLRVVSWAMMLAPFAVFGLMTRLVSNLGIDVLLGMAVYVLTVLLGLLVVTLFYLLVAKLSGIGSIRTFLGNIRELMLLAFSTSSSAAVMPITLNVVENKLRIKPDIARFLVPLGATINMTGTALYQGIATVFLAQVFQVELTLMSYVFVVTMAVAASVGSPATPGAGIIILSMILEGVGIPAAGVALILGVDRVLDMCQTSVNVLGDVVVCRFVQTATGQQEERVNEANSEGLSKSVEN
ncbi:MAG: dicarboxylate/amino acid:cation symporter [Aestuariibacter sp.]